MRIKDLTVSWRQADPATRRDSPRRGPAAGVESICTTERAQPYLICVWKSGWPLQRSKVAFELLSIPEYLYRL